MFTRKDNFYIGKASSYKLKTYNSTVKTFIEKQIICAKNSSIFIHEIEVQNTQQVGKNLSNIFTKWQKCKSTEALIQNKKHCPRTYKNTACLHMHSAITTTQITCSTLLTSGIQNCIIFWTPALSVTEELGQPVQAPCIFNFNTPLSASKLQKT